MLEKEKNMSTPSTESKTVSFPVGYHTFHKNKDINFQLNRFYSFTYWTKADAEEVGKAVNKIEEWPPILTRIAERQLANDRPLAAATSFRAAELFAFPSDPLKIQYYDRFTELVYEHIDVPGLERFSVPYQDSELPGLRLKPENARGTILLHGGYDSLKEELIPVMQYLAEAGYEVILFEGPGQGEAIRKQNLIFTHEWELPTTAVMDHLDLKDVTLIGVSLGGFLSLRAAAFEPRISRVICYDISIYDQHPKGLHKKIYELFLRYPAFYNRIARMSMKNVGIEWLMHQGMYINGVDTPVEWMELLENFSVADIAHLVKQDVLLLAGEKDHGVSIKELAKNREGLVNARSITERVFTAEEHAASHCQIGNIGLALDVMIDWLKQFQSRR